MEPLPQRAAAELLGTFLLVVVAAGIVIVDTLFDGSITLVGIATATGIIVMLMVYVLGPISGAHINPAVTLGLALSRKLEWRDAPVYWAAQLAGAAAAGGALRMMFGLVGNMGRNEPSGSDVQSLAAEVLVTFVLMLVIASVVSNPRLAPLSGVAIGSTITMAMLFLGPVSGASMNPARSFGPALASMSWASHWVYWVGPALGAAAAVLVHKFVLAGWPARASDEVQDSV